MQMKFEKKIQLGEFMNRGQIYCLIQYTIMSYVCTYKLYSFWRYTKCKQHKFDNLAVKSIERNKCLKDTALSIESYKQ